MYVSTMPITSANRSFRILSNKQFEKEFPPLNPANGNIAPKHCGNSNVWSNILKNENKITKVVSTNIKGLKDLPMKYNNNNATIIKMNLFNNKIIKKIHDNIDYIDYIDYDLTYSNKFYLGCDESMVLDDESVSGDQENDYYSDSQDEFDY